MLLHLLVSLILLFKYAYEKEVKMYRTNNHAVRYVSMAETAVTSGVDRWKSVFKLVLSYVGNSSSLIKIYEKGSGNIILKAFGILITRKISKYFFIFSYN